MNEKEKKRWYKKALWYIAHPYTPKNGKTTEDNLKSCAEICNKLIDDGFLIYSPITISHQFELLKPRGEFWYDYDLEMMKHCDGLILCPGWEDSKGCKLEYEEAKKLGLMIFKYEEMELK